MILLRNICLIQKLPTYSALQLGQGLMVRQAASWGTLPQTVGRVAHHGQAMKWSEGAESKIINVS
jgi:hypothetical protein